MSFYLYRNNQQEGPYDQATLRRGVASGRFAPEDYVYGEGFADWVPLHVWLAATQRAARATKGWIGFGMLCVLTLVVYVGLDRIGDRSRTQGLDKLQQQPEVVYIIHADATRSGTAYASHASGQKSWEIKVEHGKVVNWQHWDNDGNAVNPATERNDLADEVAQVNVGTPSNFVVAGLPFRIPELELEMLPVAAGIYTRGSPDDEALRKFDENPHSVTITQDYWLGKYEVTQTQWFLIMGTQPAHFKSKDESLPVENVKWIDAMEFCRRLTERERAAGRLSNDFAYTLPTEAQWEYACRAGTTTAYSGELNASAWHAGNSESQPQPVGLKKANSWGFHDMHGNVWEWCYDRYGNYPTGAITDPSGAVEGKNRVNRGGSWFNFAPDCRSARRSSDPEHFQDRGIGFRLCLAPVSLMAETK